MIEVGDIVQCPPGAIELEVTAIFFTRASFEYPETIRTSVAYFNERGTRVSFGAPVERLIIVRKGDTTNGHDPSTSPPGIENLALD